VTTEATANMCYSAAMAPLFSQRITSICLRLMFTPLSADLQICVNRTQRFCLYATPIASSGSAHIYGRALQRDSTAAYAVQACTQLNNVTRTAPLHSCLAQPDLVINAGTAGGFGRMGAAIGDVFVSSRTVNHDR
jgi:hypothetical protein